MADKVDVLQGTLALMILKTLEALAPLHGYGIARRIEQTSGDLLAVNYGTLYPALLKLEQEGYIRSEWGVSDNNRKAKYYSLTRAGRKQLQKEAREWEQTAAIMQRFLVGRQGDRMRRIRAGFLRLCGLFRKRRLEREMAEELAGHLDLHTEDNIRAGMSPEEARRNAMLKLGGIEATKEAYRDRYGIPLLETVARDVRYSLRTLRRNPGLRRWRFSRSAWASASTRPSSA